MNIIKITDIGVEKIFLDAFIGLTQTIAKIKLEYCAPFVWKKQDCIHLMVQTTGAFYGVVICTMDKKLGNSICEKMAFGIAGLGKEVLLQEYMNVVSGNGVSMINTKLKKASRLTVPSVMSQEEFKVEINPEMKREEIYLSSEYGFMCVEVYYNVETYNR